MRTAGATARLGDVAELNPPFAGSPPPDETVSFLPMAGVDSERADATPREVRRYSEVDRGYTPFADGDVLVAKITPCFENGKIAQARLPHRYAFGSTEFHVLRPGAKQLDGRYLVHFLRQRRIRVAGEQAMTGSAGQRRVPEHFLAGLTIPLPPLPETAPNRRDPRQSGRAARQAPRRPRPTRHPHPIHLPRHVRRPGCKRARVGHAEVG